MAYSVNWTTKLITIPTSDLTLVSGTRYQLQASDFLKEIRRLEASPTDGLWAEQILQHDNARIDFAGADYPPFDEMINGYTWTIAGAAVRCDLKGSNNNLIDVYVNTNGCSVVPSNSLGLQLVSVGSGVTAQDKTEIIDGTAAKFNFNGDGDVIATLDGELTAGGGGSIDEKTLNRVVQGAIPPPPSNGAIAKEVARLMPQPKDMSKEFKALESKLSKLSKAMKPQPENNGLATLRQQIENINHAISKLPHELPQAKDFDDTNILAQIEKVRKEINSFSWSDYSEAVERTYEQTEEIMAALLSGHKSIQADIKAIPQPDLSSLATSEELAALKSLTGKLQNYNDSDVVTLLSRALSGIDDLQEDLSTESDVINSKLNQIHSNQLDI